MQPLSNHVLRTLLPTLLAVLLLSGFCLKLLYTKSLVEDFDRALINKAISIIAITEQDEDGVELEVNYESMPNFDNSELADYFAVIDPKGEIIFQSRSLANAKSLSFDLLPRAIGDAPSFEDGLLPDGRTGRSVRMSYFPKIDIDSDDDKDGSPFFPLGQAATKDGEIIVHPTELTLWLAVERETLDSKKNLLNLTLALTGLVTALMLILTQYFAVRRAVRPIKILIDKLVTWNASELDQDLPEKTGIMETDLLTNEFTSLLKRVDSSIKREKRFSADLAHEIRTPLSEMKILLEVHERWPEDTNAARNITGELLLSVNRMERLVENLLAIGKSESGVINTSGETVFEPLVRKNIKLLGARIDAKQLNVMTEVSPNAKLSSGEHIWPQIIDNLLDNAIEYSPNGASIEIVMVIKRSGEFCFSISNPVKDLTQTDMDQIFSRMWRKDASRHSSNHSGLGLSLVKNYCELLGYQVKADLHGDGIFNIQVTGLV